MAPWLEWIARERAGGINTGNGGNDNNGNDGNNNNNNNGGNEDSSVWGQFTACAPLHQRRGQDRRRLSNEYVSGKIKRKISKLQVRSLYRIKYL